MDLQHTWTLTHDEFFDNIKEIGSFHTVEGFWRLYNNIPSASKLPHRHNFRWFKTNGASYLAEDETNIGGGQWIVEIRSREMLDDAVLDILLAMIGQTLHGCVCGMVVNVRNRADRVCIWTTKAETDEIQTLGNTIREIIRDRAGTITFKLHDAQSYNTFQAKAILHA